MDAVILAGGSLSTDDPMRGGSDLTHKSLLPVLGKPMAQWVLDAISAADEVERVIIMGLPDEGKLTSTKPLTYLPDHGGIVENIRAGMQHVLQVNPLAGKTMIASADIPAIRADMVKWLIKTSHEIDAEFYYCVLSRPVVERAFPQSKRTYVGFKDVAVCGGDLNIVDARAAVEDRPIWNKLAGARKSPVKQAAIIGFDTLLLLLLRCVTLEGAARRISKRLGINAVALLTPYAEIGMDADKPFQLQQLTDYMKNQPCL